MEVSALANGITDPKKVISLPTTQIFLGKNSLKAERLLQLIKM